MNRLPKYKYLSLFLMVLLTTTLFQNCGKVQFANGDHYNYDSQGRRIYHGSLTLGQSKPNPPLDLFFIVDNSASMLGHQIDLGAAFSTVFKSNVSSLSNFDTNIYVVSTASTFNSSFLNQIPNRAPSSIASVPASSNTTTLAAIPGNIFAIWGSSSPNPYGTIPFTLQLSPAAVLDNTITGVSNSLFIAKQGSQSSAAYQSQIQTLTQQFQNRLSYLNPSNQTSYSSSTDISSGLCSVSRILKHSSDFIKPGDAGAFIIVSDDNDRLNVRNPNNNQCVESIVGSQSLVDGTCGHFETKYTYYSSSKITYNSATVFNYQSGTNLSYKYPSSDSCAVHYSNGYNYSYTYTALKTNVTYTKCTQWGDGTCISVAPNSVMTIDGSYSAAGGACSQNMANLVSSPAPGTTFTCQSANLANQTGSGVDPYSNGSQCSSQIMSAINNANRINLVCTVGAQNFINSTVTAQVGQCGSTACTGRTSCSVSAVTTNYSNATKSFATNGLTCSSLAVTGFLATIPNSTCNSTSALTSTFTVNAASNPDGTALGCSSSLAGLTVKNSSGAAICSGMNLVSDCAQSLEQGTTSTVCSVKSVVTSSLSAAANTGCSTSCSQSGGVCAGTQTVASYLQSLRGICVGSSNGGLTTLGNLRFDASVAPTADCTAKCSDVVSGSCDGLGWGATNGATVSDYIQQKLSGGSCQSQIQKVSETSTLHVDSSNPQAACSANQVFFASSSPYAGTQINYVAGNSSHLASDFIQYISTRSAQVFGQNNRPAFATITQLAGDNLYGTDVGTDYINLTTKMGSNQVSSITADYSVALANISDFIVKTTQGQIPLGIPPTEVVYQVSVLTAAGWQPIPDTLWSWSNGTLSIDSAANLKVGDQLAYEYRDP